MTGVLLLLVALSALAWLGLLRKWPYRAWGLCALFGGLAGLAGLPGAAAELRAHPAAVILAAACAALLAAGIAGLFFCRLLPKRRKMRFLYHGAWIIFLAGLGGFFPLKILWQERLSAADNVEMSKAHQDIAGKFGLKRLNISVLGGEFPTAQVTSFSGETADVVVSSSLAKLLSHDEMQFVIAHELSHHLLKHFPVRILLAAAALAVYFLVTALVFRRRDIREEESDGRQELDIFLRRAPLYLLLGLLAALGPLAWCRRQETEADLTAVKITGNAEAAAGTLEKLAEAVPGRRRDPLQLLHAHPCLEERIARLRAQGTK